jgi:uncharacterized membrane protein YeaQ/YmgE (transglycosylase-associated protein family)
MKKIPGFFLYLRKNCDTLRVQKRSCFCNLATDPLGKEVIIMGVLLHLIWVLISGGVIGWLAGKLMNWEGSWVRNVVVGIVGSALGGVICSLIGIYSYGFIFGAIVNVGGACLLLWIIHKVMG